MKTLVISDLHLGNRAERDVLRLQAPRERLLAAVDGVDRLVLLGDTAELMTRHPERSMAVAEPVMRALGRRLGPDREVILVPGNHDGALIHRWTGAQDGRLTLSTDVPAAASPALEALVSWLAPARMRISYPGVWLGERVWATHGHYLDRHLIPEAAVGFRRGRLAREPANPARPAEYERARRRLHARAPLAQRLMSRPVGTLLDLLADVLRAGTLPHLAQLLLHAGLAPVTAALLDTQMRHSGIPAMAGVVRRLGVDADWVVFGHVHRRGPIEPERWPASGCTRFVNTGAWLYDPLLVDRAVPPHGYWPGGAVLLDDGAAPRSVGLLDDIPRTQLHPRAGAGRGRR